MPNDKIYQFAGFFPVFSEKNRNLSTLIYTKEEAKSIKKHFSKYLYLKDKATRNQFNEVEDKTAIIHLSTHANIKNQTRQTQIEFYDQPLTLTELYAREIPADLLVLSACETGIGKLQKGEGAMSLARGFSYAGVKNLLVSLWQVNDKATSELMSNFYNYLTLGLSFQKALNQSKKHYLNDKTVPNSKKSPYYWAGFVPIQNTGTAYVFKSKQNFTYLFIILGLLLIVFLTYLYLEKKQ
jgi:CHAT domain-containing protein